MQLEEGYDTQILDDGKSLSGGQKQRIAIARALVKDADILLLDEVTSALDAENEVLVMSTIKTISKEKTVLLVTHNRKMVSYGQQVVYLT